MNRSTWHHLVAAVVLAWATQGAALAEMRALLVGVSAYPTLLPAMQLEGPRNDVLRMRSVLAQRGLVQNNLILLADGVPGAQAPTRANIMRALESLAKVAKADDVIVLYFAGHGSQQPVVPGSPQGKAEPDGLHEIFLPADIGTWDGKAGTVQNALVDFELRAAVDKIRSRGAFVWGVFDACHSATLVRGGAESADVRYRHIPPEALDVPVAALDAASARASSTAATTPPVKTPEPALVERAAGGNAGGAVFFYAAQTTERTPEMRLPLGSPSREPYGLFSFMLTRALESGQPMSYRQLGQYVLAQYSGMNEARITPMFTGSGLDQAVLGQQSLPTPQWPIQPERMSVPVGALSGVQEGAIFAVVPGPLAKPGEVLGHVRAKAVRLTASDIEPVAHAGKKALAITAFQPGWYVRLVSAPVTYSLRVGLDPRACGTPCRWMPVIDAVKAKGVAGATVEWDNSAADVWLQLHPDRVRALTAAQLQASPSSGMTLLAAVSPTRGNQARSAELSQALHAMARATNLMRLRDSLKAQGQQAGLQIKLERLTQTARPKAAQAKGMMAVQTLQTGKPSEVRAGDKLRLFLTNRGQVAQDVTVLYLDAHFGIQPLFPQGQESNRLEAGASYSIDDIQLSDSTVGLEHLLVIAVEAEKFGERADFSFLTQASLPDAVATRSGSLPGDVQAFMDAAFADFRTRGVQPRVPSTRTSMQVFSLKVQ